MTTFDSTKLPLKDILRDVVEGKIQLPDFQRGWVWDDEHVRSLLVSLGRSFPVGAVMLLETGGPVRFQVRPVENVPKDKLAAPERLILDGQQRLTTLTQVLKLSGPVQTRTEKESPLSAITTSTSRPPLPAQTASTTPSSRWTRAVSSAAILAVRSIWTCRRASLSVSSCTSPAVKFSKP